MLIWRFLKLPLLFVAFIAAMRLLYLKKCFHVVEAECVVCDLNDKDGIEAYRTTYKFAVCENNVIDTVEQEVVTKEIVTIGDKEKILVRKGNCHDIRQRYCVWNALLWFVVSVCMVFAI